MTDVALLFFLKNNDYPESSVISSGVSTGDGGSNNSSNTTANSSLWYL